MSPDLSGLQLLSDYYTAEELEKLIQRATESKQSFWDVLLEDNRVTEDALADQFARRLRIRRVQLVDEVIDSTLNLIPETLARHYLCLPLRLQKNRLLLCLANPSDLHAIREVEFYTGYSTIPVVATRSEILAEIERYYASRSALVDVVRDTWESQELEVFQPEPEELDLDEGESRRAAETGPVVRLVNLMILEGMRTSASDVHIEPGENEVKVRNRVDGLLRDVMALPKWLHAGIVSRVKILANLDISEKRRSQDGHIGVYFRQKRVDMRVSTLPTRDGEKVVLRILGSGKGIPAIEELGLEADDRELLLRAIAQPQGMILVTGPTGSGKTTSLYSALLRKRSPELNIVTIEDPVEYDLAHINQVQVNRRAGMTFANSLRSILRQDPDVILLGEIRDQETAEIAFHAAMTGHMVLSSLHTHTTLGTVYRLLELGIEPFLVSSCVNLAMAQRLVRTICLNCRERYTPAPSLLSRLGVGGEETVFYRGKGCEECGQTGYAGRIGIFELLPVTPDVQDAITQRASETQLLRLGRAAGMHLLLEDAQGKVKAGVTTVEEVLRVVHLREALPLPCPHCRALIRPNFSTCPYCLTPLHKLCASCGQELQQDWRICPYCNRSTDASEPSSRQPDQWTQ
ncbi:MAG: ATPase, T2SS/T4P/T4SS family [Terriglobia bacterium]